jgi:hypothetical protein
LKSADDIDRATLRRVAEVTWELFQKPEIWIHRRVERIYFKDCQMAHHQVSVDFTLPAGVRPVGRFEDKDVYVAPLFLLVKGLAKPPREGKPPRHRFIFFGKIQPDLTKPVIPTAPYSNLDVVNQEGQRLSLLTRSQSSRIAALMLLEAAEQALGKPVAQKLKEAILRIPYDSRLDLVEVLHYLLEERICYCFDPRIKLRSDPVFPELAYTLASHSIIVCTFIGPPGRSICKLSYDEPINEGFSTSKGRIRRSFGLKSEQYSVALNEIGASASYHVEIEIPDGLLINAVNLIGKRYRWYGDLETRQNQSYSIRQIGKTTEGKIYIPEPLPGRQVGLAWVKLRVQRSGFLAGALVASILITLTLTVGAFVVPVVIKENQSESATATLLLLPAILAAYIARPGEHAITARMLRWARYALLLDGVLPVVAVLLLVTTQHHEESHSPKAAHFSTGAMKLGTPSPLWIGLAALSVFFIILFTLTNIIPMPYGKTVYLPRLKRYRYDKQSAAN